MSFQRNGPACPGMVEDPYAETQQSTGTRSSTPWNMPAKSRSGGSRSGANPKHADAQPAERLRVRPAGQAVRAPAGAPGSSACSAAAIASTSGAVEVGLERDVVVDELAA